MLKLEKLGGKKNNMANMKTMKYGKTLIIAELLAA